MNRSIVISLRGIFKKIFIIALIVILIIGLIYFEIPGKLFLKMAENTINPKANTGAFAKLFSLSTDIPYTSASAAMPQDMPLKKDEKKTEIALAPEKTPENTDLSASVSTLSVSDKGVIVSNIAKKSFNISELLKRPLKFDKNSSGYKILILHSHTTEAYFPVDRSDDQSNNIVKVGQEFEKVFNENGIKALHITKVHDAPYSLSYKNSLETVTNTLKNNPSIEIVIDVHRDAVFDKNNEKLKPVCTIEQKNAAQVMIVTGTDAGGLPHNNWSDNLAFSLKVQQKMNEQYKGLARPINLSKERYNTHTTKASIIFEVGANGNTIDEAVLGAHYAALSIVSLLS